MCLLLLLDRIDGVVVSNYGESKGNRDRRIPHCKNGLTPPQLAHANTSPANSALTTEPKSKLEPTVSLQGEKPLKLGMFTSIPDLKLFPYLFSYPTKVAAQNGGKFRLGEPDFQQLVRYLW